MTNASTKLKRAFEPNRFREQGHRLVDLLADFLDESQTQQRSAVLPQIPADEMLDRWSAPLPAEPAHGFEGIINKVLEQSNNLQHPRYVGHQCCSPLPLAALTDLVGSLLNNGSAVYEMGPVNVVLEQRLVQWMCQLIGYPDTADGIFTHGGTVGNLTALLAARQIKTDYDVWRNGVQPEKPLSVLVSEDCHYSIKRAVGIMGLGEAAVLTVPVNHRYQLDLAVARRRYDEALADGRQVFLIVGNACSTATGSYDDLNAIADFAEERNLWFHVDAAHGASAALSATYRHLLDGLQRADSLVWDAHKMLLTPALATTVLFKDGSNSYASFSQKASYLFEKESKEEWYDMAHRTMECTKAMLGLKLYVPLMVYGTDLFADFVTHTYDLTKQFAAVIERAADFELAAPPQSNIICFRHTRPGVTDLDDLQKRIRQGILKEERFYIVQTALKSGFYLRCTIINPLTTLEDLTDLLDAIRALS